MVRVKICGIKTLEDARAVAALGPDMLGFHVGLARARAPLSAETAGGIIRQLPDSIEGVLVTSMSKPDELVQALRTTGAKILQLYGDTTPEEIQEVKSRLPHIKVWKVLSATGDSPVFARRYEDAADALVLDSANNAGQIGGTGFAHDWSVSSEFASSLQIPIVLAGGLTPDNVEAAIKKVRPYAVDVNSGVSNKDGSKDLAKVKKFIESAKST